MTQDQANNAIELAIILARAASDLSPAAICDMTRRLQSISRTLTAIHARQTGAYANERDQLDDEKAEAKLIEGTIPAIVSDMPRGFGLEVNDDPRGPALWLVYDNGRRFAIF